MVFKRNLKKGFTLVELLVTISIFVILTGVVLFSQSKFNSTILLTNLAYDTALTIRQAQTYGINIKEFTSISGDQNFFPYGVHFDIGSEEANNKAFILFADVKYIEKGKKELTPYQGDLESCNTGSGCVNRYSIKRGNRISNLYVTNGSSCDDRDSLTIVDNGLDIIFQRPNPDAKIYANKEQYNLACIELMGEDGSSKTVMVQKNGLIEVLH